MTAVDWLKLQRLLIQEAQKAADEGSKTDHKSAMWPIHFGNAQLLAALAHVCENMRRGID